MLSCTEGCQNNRRILAAGSGGISPAGPDCTKRRTDGSDRQAGERERFYDLVPGNRGIVPVLSISQDRTFLGGRAGTLASAGVYDRNDL